MRIYLSLADPGNYGWGVCSKNLAKELAKRCEVVTLTPDHRDWNHPNLPGVHFMALAGDLQTRSPARGRVNIGYTFFEGRLPEIAVKNASYYDYIFMGSTWCCELARQAGIEHCSVLLQGVDTQLFAPEKCEVNGQGPLVLFSGSKLEFRKGQDLTIAAVRRLQERYSDIHLITLWDNYLDESLHSMNESLHIKFELLGKTWEERATNLCEINGLDPARVFSLAESSHEDCPAIYHGTDLGIFPSRCESGTNLVLMEYMACGRPALVSATGGHLDVINEENAIPLNKLKEVEMTEYYGKPLSATWQEVSVDEIVEKVEYYYVHREELRGIGNCAAESMSSLTWEKTADEIIRKCFEWE